MKKVLSILAVSVVLALLALPVFAENTLDLKSMTTEELAALQVAVNAELMNRNFATKEVIVPPGTYTIGVDIPAGDYSFRCDDRIAGIDIESAQGKFVTGHSLTKGETVGKQPLEDGQTIEISYGSVVFMPYRGLGF